MSRRFFMFLKPGQYRMYNIGWLPLLTASIIIAVLCFFCGWYFNNSSNEITELQGQINQHNQKYQELVKSINDIKYTQQPVTPPQDNLKERLDVIGTAFNENFATVQGKDFVFITRDWKLSRVPRRLNIDLDDLKWMETVHGESVQGSPRVPKN